MRRGWRPAVTGLALLLLATSCASDGDGPAETTAERAPVRSTTTTAPPRPALEQVTAEPGVLAAPGDQRMVAVAADAEGATGLAVGTHDGEAAAWRATDADTWERVALDRSVVPADAQLRDVAGVSDGGFVVVGDVGGVAAAWRADAADRWRAASVDAGPGMAHVAETGVGLVGLAVGGGPAVWRSHDGNAWVRAVDAVGALDDLGVERVAGVVDVGRGVVAVVERTDRGPELWSSSDGFAWSVAPGRGDDLLPSGGTASVHGLTRLADGRIVAGGAVARADGIDAAAWASPGGRAWEPAPQDENELGGDGAQVMETLVDDGQGRVVAIGSEVGTGRGGIDLAVWTSGDGIEWLRADPEQLRRQGRQHGADAAVVGGVVVAVGWESGASGEDAAVWRIAMAPSGPPASDGAASPPWVRIDADALGAPGEQRLEGIAVAAGGYVAVGAVRAPLDDEGVAGPSRSGGPVPVGASDGAVWLSPDSREWLRADDGAMAGDGDQEVLAVAHGPRGVVAVGGDGDDAAVWFSPDGRSWRRSGDRSPFGGPGRQVAVDVVALSSGYLAVGRDEGSGDGDAAVWLSLDGRGWRRVDGLDADGTQAMHAVAVVGERVVVVGRDGEEAAVWVTDDLGSWSRSSLGAASVQGIDARDGAAVAVGSVVGAEGERQAATWRLSGDRWERVTGGELDGPGNQELQSVALGDDIAIAVGRTDLGGGGDAASWTSADAATWNRTLHDENVLGGDGEQRMTEVVIDGPTAVAVGWSGPSPEARDAVVWVADQIDVSEVGRNL